MERPYLSVTALTKYLKRKFDVDPYLEKVWLTGEISNLRLRTNSHQYFSVKDDKAVISAVMFKSSFEKLKFVPNNGMKVLIVGRVSLYEPSGTYQIYVEKMEPDGIGALYQAYEQLKNKLQESGIFDRPKRLIPKFPKKIAVLTSPSGAVIQDIQTTIQRRFPIVQIILYPTIVQGAHSKESILNNLEQVNHEEDIDVIIIGRGGGSIEDLWSFNEEEVVRKIATMKIPIITSIGHETDTTLSDFASDMRAPTPTAAAELATPELYKVYRDIELLRQRLIQTQKHYFEIKRKELQKLATATVFRQPQRLYEVYLQKVDRLEKQLKHQTQQRLNQSHYELDIKAQKILRYSPIGQIQSMQRELRNINQRLYTVPRDIVQQKRNDLNYLMKQLDLLSPLKNMLRGYAIVEKNEKIISSISAVQVGDNISLQFPDGIANATITQLSQSQIDEIGKDES